MPRPRPEARPKKRTYQQGPHLFKREGRDPWYARGGSLPRGGKCLHTTDRAEAERQLADLIARGAAGPVAEAPAEAPLPEIVDAYLDAPHGYTAQSKRTAKNRLIAFGAWLRDHRVSLASEITPQIIDDWVTARSAECSRRTINRDLRAMRVCLRWGAERGLCAAVSVIEDRKDLKEPHRPQRREIPSPDEWRKILAACDSERARASIAALLATGLRIEELRRLHLGSLRAQGDGYALSVEPEQGPADEAWTTKGYRTREIPLTSAAGKAVLAYLAVAVGPRKAVVQESWLLRKLKAACAAAGVPPAGVHDTRRAFVTEGYRHGVPIAVIAVWCGHADVRTTEGYLASYRTDREVVAPMPEALTPAAPKPAAKVRRLAESRLNPGGAQGAPERKSDSAAAPRHRAK